MSRCIRCHKRHAEPCERRVGRFLQGILPQLALLGTAILPALALAPRSISRAISPDDPQTVVRVSTRLVQMSVVVQKRDGSPVDGLTRDDFSIWDDGQAQKISVFSVQSNRTLPAALASLPLGTFTNRVGGRGEVPGSATIVLLDGLNTHFEDQAYAKAQIIKFLKQIQPQDRVALYTLTTNLSVLHDFTADSKVLVEALQGYAGSDTHEIAASEPPPQPSNRLLIIPSVPNQNASQQTIIKVGLEDYMHQTLQQSADWYSMDRTLKTLDALKTIARALGHVPGRKNLVWVSSTFPFTIGSGTANAENVVRGQRTFGPEIERAERLLNDANLAVYPVDARGLVGAFGVNPNLSAERSLTARLPMDNPTIEGLGQLTPTQDTMEELSRETGGRAFYGTNDIMGSIRRALDDGTLTYTLGYYPAEKNWDGRFHEIKVRARAPGAKVLCRRGYFAVQEAPPGAKERQQAMMEAAGEPLDATAIGLTVRKSPASQTEVLPLTVDIDLRGVTLLQQGGRWVGSLNLLFAQMSPTGQMLNGFWQPVHLRLTPDQYQDLLQKGLSISGPLQIARGAERVRVVAFDPASSALGSVTVPLEPASTTR